MSEQSDKYLPKVSFLVLTYNQENYIYDAIMSGCSQDYEGEMEIVVSDDASTDRTQQEIERAIRDNTSQFCIRYNRQNTNQGIGGNMHDGLALCSGDIIVYNDGDDVSLSHRVSHSVNIFAQYRDVLLVGTEINWLCNGQECPLESHPKEPSLTSLSDCINDGMRWNLWGCTLAYRREIIDQYPEMLRTTPTSDTWIRLRAYMLYADKKTVYASNEVCLNYRIHEKQLTNATNIKQMNRTHLSQQYWRDYLYALVHHTYIHTYIHTYRAKTTPLYAESTHSSRFAIQQIMA